MTTTRALRTPHHPMTMDSYLAATHARLKGTLEYERLKAAAAEEARLTPGYYRARNLFALYLEIETPLSPLFHGATPTRDQRCGLPATMPTLAGLLALTIAAPIVIARLAWTTLSRKDRP